MGASFFICLALVLLIGLSSARQAKASAADYFVASRSVPPWLVGLSAVATNNSGYMFIGLIGYTYAVGIQSVWLMVGWIAGAVRRVQTGFIYHYALVMILGIFVLMTYFVWFNK